MNIFNITKSNLCKFIIYLNALLIIYGITFNKLCYASYSSITIKSICKISGKKPFNIKKEKLSRSIQVYKKLDENSWNNAYDNYNDTYSFPMNGNKRFVAYAKASYSKEELMFTVEKECIENCNTTEAKYKTVRGIEDPLTMLDIYFVTKIDYKHKLIAMESKFGKGETKFTITINDFQELFIWYTELLDQNRLYIPVYGFFSIPKDTATLPNTYYSWNKKDVFKYIEEEKLHFDFYKILDYKNGCYLVAKELIDFEAKRHEIGILGWIEAKYIVLWRSRLYYHPKNNESSFYYNSPLKKDTFNYSNLINKYYVTQCYPGKKVFQKMLQEDVFTAYDNYYKNFGFPELYPPYGKHNEYAKVCILGAFTSFMLQKCIQVIKENLLIYTLLDTSKSMRKYHIFVQSFYDSVRHWKNGDFAINQKIICLYNESSDSSVSFNQFVPNLNDEINISYGEESKDQDFKEPLLSALNKIVSIIKTKNNESSLYKNYYKILFILTDAGANDWDKITENQLTRDKIADEIINQNIFTFFITPNTPPQTFKNYNSMIDNPLDAYNHLRLFILPFFIEKSEKYFKNYTFEKNNYKKSFDQTSEEIISKIENALNSFINVNNTFKEGNLLLFVPDTVLKLLEQLEYNTNINNHVIKYIQYNEKNWDERIAIPYTVINHYINQINDAKTIQHVGKKDFIKLFIVTSLISDNKYQSCLEKYEAIKTLLRIEGADSLESRFVEALTGKTTNTNGFTKYEKILNGWIDNKKLKNEYIIEREFFLNIVEFSNDSHYIYLKEDDFNQL